MTGKQRASRRRIALQQPNETPYDILGISESATENEIRRAYLRMVRLSPPERDPEAFKRIREAYGHLVDLKSKRELDLSLFQTEPKITADNGAEYDYRALVQYRLFQLLLASSDFYAKSFSRHFDAINKRIAQLR